VHKADAYQFIDRRLHKPSLCSVREDVLEKNILEILMGKLLNAIVMSKEVEDDKGVIFGGDKRE